MGHMDFVVWMVGFPIANAISDYVGHLRGHVYSEGVKMVANIASVMLWGGIGVLLW